MYALPQLYDIGPALRWPGTVVASLCLAGTLTAEAATLPAEQLFITEDQASQLLQLFSKIDADIKGAMKGNEELQQRMQNELRAIVSLKDKRKAIQAIGAYQRRYAEDYAGILGKAGVDLTEVASRINVIVPGLNAQAQPNFTITSRRRFSSGTTSTSTGSQGKRIRVRKFRGRRSLSCGVMSGSDVSFTGSSIINETFSAVAEGCFNVGIKNAIVKVPRGATAVDIAIKGDLSTEVLAVGVLGAATASASANIDFDGVDSFVVAPFLWAGSAEQSVRGFRSGRRFSNPPAPLDAMVAFTHSSSYASGLIGGTRASAKVTNLQVTATAKQ